ncbi:MAG: cytochrome b N-terminal domain-containing protein [Spirochaetales bacterium]|nr:cytochrome b N-terminal domain-containing protein [Spirochaetales bacterium]
MTGPLLRFLRLLESAWGRVFPAPYQFFYFLGAMPILLLVILFLTGLYLFIYYSMAVESTYASLQYMTERAWGGRFMRGLHRYAADAMVFFTLLHMLRVWLEGRYQNHRRLAWWTGIGILVLLLIQGVTGYVMPLDSQAHFVLEKTAELLSSLRIFGDTLPRSFSSPALMGKWIMWVILIIHFAIPLFFIFLIFLHVKRIARARILPPTRLGVAFGAVLVLVTLFFPVRMLSEADASQLPFLEHSNWFFLFFAPFLREGHNLQVFAFFAAVTLLLTAIPWLTRAPVIEPAKVDLDKCTGCTLCALDCPYEAIRMRPRPDGKHKLEAVVDADLCSGCGVCLGSCDFDAMAFANTPNADWETRMRELVEKRPGDFIEIVCDKNRAAPALKGESVLAVRCTGILGPALTDTARKLGARGILLGACRMGDCAYREGNSHTLARMENRRKPYLKRVKDFPVQMISFNPVEGQDYVDLQKLARESQGRGLFSRQTVRPVHLFLVALTVAMLGFAFYAGALANYGTVEPIRDRALLRLDFFRLTGSTSCNLDTIPADKLSALRKEKMDRIGFGNLDPEAQVRIRNNIEEGIKEQFCSRSRRPLRVIVTQDGQREEKIYQPSGLQNDGMVYVLRKLYLPPGKHHITVRTSEIDGEKEEAIVEADLELEFKPGQVHFLDFDRASQSFFLRNPKRGQDGR